jgi:transposase-like protein
MAAIEGGSNIAPACRQLGICEKTLFMRVMRDQEAAGRFAEAKH